MDLRRGSRGHPGKNKLPREPMLENFIFAKHGTSPRDGLKKSGLRSCLLPRFFHFFLFLYSRFCLKKLQYKPELRF